MIDIPSFIFSERKEQLPEEKIAEIIRDKTIDMVDYGVVGSNSLIPESTEQNSIPVHTLLQYSHGTKQHLNALQGILRGPREFTIIDMADQKPGTTQGEGNVLLRKEKSGHYYEFPHEMTSPYINAFAAGFDTSRRKTARMGVDIKRDDNHNVWVVEYGYHQPPPDSTIFDASYPDDWGKFIRQSVGNFSSPINPEKQLLLNFIFSPRELSGKEMIERLPFFYTNMTRECMSYKGTKDTGKFRTTTLGFNAENMYRKLKASEKSDPQEGALHEGYATELTTLQKQGNREFQVIQLGKTRIGTQAFFIYSAAERPIVSEIKPIQHESPVPTTIPILQPV